MTRILITGASGFLGHNLAVGLSERHEVFAGFCVNPPDPGRTTPVQFDVADAREVLSCIHRLGPELVIHSAALSQPDECERSPERALEVIVSGTRNVAEACDGISARLLHISTDLVFDGERGGYTEEDSVHGISVYARAKIQAERIVHSVNSSGVILRVALLFGIGSSSHPGSLAATVRRWREGREQTFYTDQFRTPTFAPQVAEAVEKLIASPAVRGTFHLGGADRLSRFQIATGLAERAGIAPDLVRSGSMRDSLALAQRGADCSLVSEKIRETLGIRPLGFAEALTLMQDAGVFASL